MKKTFLAIIASIFIVSPALAGGGIGISGSLYNISADVTETTTAGSVAGGSANTNSKSVDHDLVPVGSIFAEYTFDFGGITLGLDYTPGAADVSKNVQSRTETPTSGENEDTSTTYKANAEIENLMTAYIEIPIYGNMYIKGGYSEVDVNTEESGVAAYGNASGIEGVTYGIGLRSGSDTGLNYKFAYEVMEFDTLSITSTSGNKVSGDIDTSGFKASLVYNF